ncbi:hypothetical protein BLNAU_4472 [Blattamonas nauphoetae]|uniref:Uncharacterized protein n=1 Tax=Blattamonas nauphoetae TaxID=2049346 RepID=A0ABQ9YA95_9EUKA|nr:hypothetical protein BLNAU_4472 [Blattamonas nauphoetae]
MNTRLTITTDKDRLKFIYRRPRYGLDFIDYLLIVSLLIVVIFFPRYIMRTILSVFVYFFCLSSLIGRLLLREIQHTKTIVYIKPGEYFQIDDRLIPCQKRNTPIYFSEIDFFFIHEAIKRNRAYSYLGGRLRESNHVIHILKDWIVPRRILLPLLRTLKQNKSIE